MATYVGVDWASRGWLAVTVDEAAEWTAEMHPSMHSVWYKHRDAQSILVDIPIGLPEDHRRTCDEKAKEFLGTGRSRSVFWTPCRDAVYEDTYAEAKETNLECRGDSLSSQAWGLSPRIREVDTLLLDDSEAQEVILESHPEVCFAAFTEAELGSKHEADGIADRKVCLDEVEGGSAQQFEDFVQLYIENQPDWARRIGSSNRDDLLDAMALALTAKIGEGDYSRLPSGISPEDGYDAEGLLMQIVYAEP